MLPKLVRNKIPEIIDHSEGKAIYHIAVGKEMDRLIVEKMLEEVLEFKETPCIEEAADVYEVFLAMINNWNFNISDVKIVAKIKKDIKGGFNKNIVLDRIDKP